MKSKQYLIAGSLLTLAVIMAMLLRIQLRQTVVGSGISARELEQMEAELEFCSDPELRILCNGETIPYDAGNDTYYLPQTTDSRWIWETKFSSSVEGMEVYWLEDTYWENIENAIADGHEFSFIVTDGQTAQKGKIVFTGLPMLNLERLETLEEDYFYCKVTVLDPFHNDSGRYEITNCYGYYDLRGKTSRVFPKRGWNLDLVQEDGSQFKMSMMGLREDDDWKLNALYSDATKIKEMVCMDLWNEIAEQTETPYDAGTDMEFFELVVDEEYNGLYGMMEQIDFQQLSLDKNEDLLYKGYSWPEESDIHVQDYNGRGIYCGQVIKPGNQDITQETWQPIIDYIEATNFDYTEEATDTEQLYTYVQEHMNLENLLNIDLYVQALYGYDNKYKNLYIAADCQADGDYTLWKLPWDLNYTFGDRFLLEDDNRTEYHLEWSQEVMKEFMATEVLLESGNQEFAVALNEKWKELREGILSLENVQEIAESHMESLMYSGAFARDAKKWPESAHDASLEPMLEFHGSRLEFLDEYYASFLNEK